MRTKTDFRQRALLSLLGVILVCLATQAVLAQAARLFQQLQLADTIEERSEICDRSSIGEETPYAALFCNGYALLAAGRDSLADQYLEAALRTRPDLAIGCVLFADAYMELDDLDRAEKWFMRARGIDPNRLDPHYGIGKIWLDRAESLGKPAYEQALASLREMTRIDPSSPDGWANVGMVQATLGHYEDAERSYERALSITPEDPVLHYSIGSLAALRGEDEGAEKSWQRALEIDPSQASAILELASLYGRQGRNEEAVATLQQGVEAAHIGPSAGRLRRDLGLLYLLAGEMDEAVELLEEARVLSPDPRTLTVLGHLRFLQGSIEAGAAHLAEATLADSAVASPIIRAWAPQILAARQELARLDPGFAKIERIARTASPSDPSGSAGTRALIERLLPDWKLPQEGFTVPEDVSELPYDTPPVPSYRALASYPAAAGGISGTILVQVRIDENGRVVEAGVVGKGGNPALEYAALDAARNWRFQPAQLGGKSVASEVTIPFQFTGR